MIDPAVRAPTTAEKDAAIESFFAAVEKLRDLGVIRSNKHVADIAEFICCTYFGMELVESGNNKGYDGVVDGERWQVKFSGGKSTTIDLGDPSEYDRLIIVLGRDSVLRPSARSERWLVYSIPSAEVENRSPHAGGVRRYTKAQIPQSCFVGGFNSLDGISNVLQKR